MIITKKILNRNLNNLKNPAGDAKYAGTYMKVKIYPLTLFALGVNMASRILKKYNV